MTIYILFDKINNRVAGVLDIRYSVDINRFRVEELHLDSYPEVKKFYMVVWPTKVNNDKYAQSIQPSTKEIFYLNTVRFNRYAYVLAHNDDEALKLSEKLFEENDKNG